MSLSVVLLAYNEAENLKFLLPRINKTLIDMNIEYNVWVIDSPKSDDNTEEICKENNAKYVVQEYPDYVGAFKTGIQYADKDKMLVMDADDSHNPDTIPEIYSKFNEGYDVVIGSRYTEGGITHDYKHQIIMSKILNFVMRIVCGINAKDISTSFRIYDTKLIKSIDLQRKNYDVQQEIILKMKLKKKDFSVAEVPIVFEKRAYGKSKRELFKFIIGYFFAVFYFIFIRLKSIGEK